MPSTFAVATHLLPRYTASNCVCENDRLDSCNLGMYYTVFSIPHMLVCEPLAV